MNKKAYMAGFTLIEVLVALVVVSVAVLSLGNFTILTIGTGQVSRERITAVHLAEQVMEFWQHDAQDFVPGVDITIAGCSLTKGGSASNSLHVVCTPTSGVGISYTIDAVPTQLTGPMPANLSVFQNFTKQGYNNMPYTKLVTVSWTNKGKSHSVYLTHLSMVK